MNTQQLLDFVQSEPILKRLVKGVYASNTIPEVVMSFPSAFIINTQPLPLPGEHWVAVIMHSSSEADFFDSLGKPLETYPLIENFIYKNSEHCNVKCKRLQPSYSNLCGLYVLVFLISRLCLKMPLSRTYALFSSNIQYNDNLVQKFIHDFCLNK
jgi:hypothetical protein